MSWLDVVLQSRSDRALSFLLAFLLILLFVIYPFFPPEGLGKYFIDVFFSLALISGTFAVEKRNLRRIALGLMAITLLTSWATYATPSRELLIASTTLGIIFFSFASVVILGRVFAAGPVTRHRVEGAVAVYLLVGLIFGSIFTLIAMLQPDAFEMAELATGGATTTKELYDALVGRLSYFSFVTLTTVGYGDVTPVTPVARQFAVLEGLIGQLYPAILLARLVSLQISAPTYGD